MADRLLRWTLMTVTVATFSAIGSSEAHAFRFLERCRSRHQEGAQQQVIYSPATAPVVPVVAGYATAAPVVRQPTVAYSFPTGTYPPYPTSPSPQYSAPGFGATTPRAAVPAPVMAVPAATAPTLAAPPTANVAPAQPPTQTAAYPFTPRVTYRTVWAAVPVTTYRPVTSAAGTSLQPCNRLRWQARRVPQTAFQPMAAATAPPATTAYSMPAPTSAYAMPAPTTAYSMPAPTTAYSLPNTTTRMPLPTAVQPAAGTINSTTAYDSYGASTAWSAYPAATALPPAVTSSRYPAGAPAAPPVGYPPTVAPPAPTSSAPQVAPPGYTYQLVPKQPEGSIAPQATDAAPAIPLSPVPADTRPRLETYPPAQKQTLMRPPVQMRRVQPVPSATGAEKPPLNLPLDPPAAAGSPFDSPSGSARPGSGSGDPYQETQSSGRIPATVTPVRPRLQPIPYPQSLEAASPTESTPALIRPRTHTASAR